MLSLSLLSFTIGVSMVVASSGMAVYCCFSVAVAFCGGSGLRWYWGFEGSIVYTLVVMVNWGYGHLGAVDVVVIGAAGLHMVGNVGGSKIIIV